MEHRGKYMEEMVAGSWHAVPPLIDMLLGAMGRLSSESLVRRGDGLCRTLRREVKLPSLREWLPDGVPSYPTPHNPKYGG